MSDHRVAPDWLVREPYTDTDLGVLKSGKEAQVSLVGRVDYRVLASRSML